MLRTRVFELAREAGYSHDWKLAIAIGVSPSMLAHIRTGKRQIGGRFIQGAMKAFPGKSYDELFFEVPDRELAEIAGA